MPKSRKEVYNGKYVDDQMANGIPEGGTTGQVLKKTSNDDYDVEWGTGGGGSVTAVTATAPITSTGGATPDISTSMSTNKLIGRGSAGTGVMEEITLGTGLSLSGTTLNASAAAGDSFSPFLLMGA